MLLLDSRNTKGIIFSGSIQIHRGEKNVLVVHGHTLRYKIIHAVVPLNKRINIHQKISQIVSFQSMTERKCFKGLCVITAGNGNDNYIPI